MKNFLPPQPTDTNKHYTIRVGFTQEQMDILVPLLQKQDKLPIDEFLARLVMLGAVMTARSLEAKEEK